MMTITTAKNQARMIAQAINGRSSSLQTLGNIGTDPHPERLLAVAVAHAGNAIEALIKVVDDLETEVAYLRSRVR